MSSSLRKIKRQKDRASDELPLREQKLPTGRIVSGTARGVFTAIPLLGYVAARDRDRIPLVMLLLGLVKPNLSPEESLDPAFLEVEIPLYLDTEAATIAALERFGWGGLSWALNEPPPFESWSTAEELTILMGTQRLQRTLIFAPDPVTGGQPAQDVEVMRARGRFLMPPLEAPIEPPKAELVKALRDLVLAYRTFYCVEHTAEEALPRRLPPDAPTDE